MQERPKDAWRIFVLVDTHNRLPENVKEMAKDADEIWHLGDVCTEVSRRRHRNRFGNGNTAAVVKAPRL
jgi:predicted phosphodiesterase